MRACRRQLLEGLDPLDAKHSQRAAAQAAAAKGMTFEQVAGQMISAHEGAWKNAKHRQQWRNTLKTYAYPVIGALPVETVDTALVMKILTPIWSTKTETASRVRMRIERVLAYAKANKMREGDNPAAWKDHLSQLLPAPNAIRVVRHHPALPIDDMPAFMAELRANSSVSAGALEVTVLCALRTDSPSARGGPRSISTPSSGRSRRHA